MFSITTNPTFAVDYARAQGLEAVRQAEQARRARQCRRGSESAVGPVPRTVGRVRRRWPVAWVRRPDTGVIAG